ncbi:uncharacterized protein [Aristolochia californica]|uniref:uncharacterized protein isoform X1 n=1 Tax=Aristolochia californica TaxID=171875 RepID=UPI0035D7C62D
MGGNSGDCEEVLVALFGNMNRVPVNGPECLSSEKKRSFGAGKRGDRPPVTSFLRSRISGEEEENAAELKIGDEFLKAKCLMNCEVSLILERSYEQSAATADI